MFNKKRSVKLCMLYKQTIKFIDRYIDMKNSIAKGKNVLSLCNLW